MTEGAMRAAEEIARREIGVDLAGYLGPPSESDLDGIRQAIQRGLAEGGPPVEGWTVSGVWVEGGSVLVDFTAPLGVEMVVMVKP